MKFPKAIRVIYTATLLAVGVLVAQALHPVQTPERVDNLPGRPASIMAPTASASEYRRGQLERAGCVGLYRLLVPDTTGVCGRFERFLLSGEHVYAAHSPKLSNATANLAADTVAALFNSCYLKGYDGTQAATADTAVGAQVLLFTLRCNATAFGSASAGLATANAITSDTDAAATGTATWFRVLKSDNSTVIMDGSLGTTGADINLATVSIAQHATVSVTSFTYQQAKS